MNEQESNELLNKLEGMRDAYRQLYTGASTLIDTGSLYWTERLLLRLVRALYGRRLQQLGEVLPDDR